MKFIFEDENITVSDIQKLIDNQIEESIHLEYKQSDAFGKTDGKRKEIAKDVSSFANSDGGIIIYGLTEQNHKAESLSFINGNEFTKEWLEQTIQSNVQRNIPNLKIVPIRFEGDIEKTIYVVIIPESFDAPHMSKDNKYYKRHNFQSVVMEEYEVRQTFNKKGLSKLEIYDCVINKDDRDFFEKDGYNSFIVIVLIKITSNFIEENYKTVVYFKNYNSKIKLSTPREAKADSILSSDFAKVSTPGISPIFQDEVLSGSLIYLDVPKKDCDEVLNGIEVEIDLLYTNGTHSKDFLMKDIYATLHT